MEIHTIGIDLGKAVIHLLGVKEPLMTLKTETVAPMPRATEKIAVSAKPGWCRNWRQA